MANTIGHNVKLTIFGESHGSYIGAVLDNVEAGIEINEEYIKNELSKRRPFGKISTSRVEMDNFEIVSGVFNNKTTGTALTIIIPNKNKNSADYEIMKGIARPGHADLTAHIKYNGYEDYRGGGHFSGRITAALVCICSILKCYLEQKGIYIASHISKLANIEDEKLYIDIKTFLNEDNKLNNYTKNDIIEMKKLSNESLLNKIKMLNSKIFPTISSNTEKLMLTKIEEIAAEGDSVGGVLETCIYGIEYGLGSPFFDSVESYLSHLIFSIPAVKGIIFGNIEDVAISNYKCGSSFNDSFYYLDDDNFTTLTNNNAGINGGITNGEPILFKTYVKPTPSIFKEQKTINFLYKENIILQIKGRHDPSIVHRIRTVIDNLTAFGVYDLLLGGK